MATFAAILAVWTVVSVPVGIVVGKVIAGPRDHRPQGRES
jgi:hypothetical protein